MKLNQCDYRIHECLLFCNLVFSVKPSAVYSLFKQDNKMKSSNEQEKTNAGTETNAHDTFT